VDVTAELPTEHRAIMRSISGLLLAVFVGALSTNILATALPRILVSLQMGVSTYTYIVTAYLLVLTVSVPLWGKLADVWDKKRLLECVVALYVLSSLVAGSATSAPVLILGRAVQGLGTGGLAALGQVVLAAIIAPRERGRYNGYTGAAVAGGTVAGPLVGGLLVNTPIAGWRACFFVSIPLGILAGYLIHTRLATTPRLTTKVVLDWVGALLLVSSTSIFVVWVSLLGSHLNVVSWVTPAVLVVVAVLGWLFVRVELRAPEPLIRIGLLRGRPVLLTSAAAFGSGVVAFAVPLFLAQYFQLGRGLSPAVSGAATLPLIAGIFAASWVVGRLITATGRMKMFLLFGALAQTVGLTAVAVIIKSDALVLLALAVFVVGLGVGTLQQNLVLYVQNVIRPEELGAGSGVVQFTRFLGGALALSAGGTLAASRVVTHVSAGLHAVGVTGGLTQVPNLATATAAIRHAYEWGYTQAIHELLLAMAPITLVSVVAVLFLREVRLSRTIRRVPEVEIEIE
jgi:MFS family permease